MIFVFSPSGQFQRMIRPYYIEYCENDRCILYVQDALGRFCTLTFPDHALLAEAMQTYRSTHTVSVRCEFAFYDPYADREREIVVQEQEEDYQLEIG